MTVRWVSPEDRARIRRATRNRCEATTVHEGHAHVCDGPGDHNGFGDETPTTLCEGNVLTWRTTTDVTP